MMSLLHDAITSHSGVGSRKAKLGDPLPPNWGLAPPDSFDASEKSNKAESDWSCGTWMSPYWKHKPWMARILMKKEKKKQWYPRSCREWECYKESGTFLKKLCFGVDSSNILSPSKMLIFFLIMPVYGYSRSSYIVAKYRFSLWHLVASPSTFFHSIFCPAMLLLWWSFFPRNSAHPYLSVSGGRISWNSPEAPHIIPFSLT